MRHIFLSVAATLVLALPGQAQDHGGAPHDQPYAGLESRQITSLSEADIAELRRGGGWGLALPAELNGLPGPAHILELGDALGLTPGQRAEVERIFADMQAEAIVAGDRLIAAERALDSAFRDEALDTGRLAALVGEAEAARAELRVIHLSRHLMTPAILRPDQIDRYAVLRGYADDPCATVPEGHDPARWRLHNACD